MPVTYRVSTKTAELLPPKASSLITEAATFQRTHWEELSPFWQAISGEADQYMARSHSTRPRVLSKLKKLLPSMVTLFSASFQPPGFGNNAVCFQA